MDTLLVDTQKTNELRQLIIFLGLVVLHAPVLQQLQQQPERGHLLLCLSGLGLPQLFPDLGRGGGAEAEVELPLPILRYPSHES